MPHPYPKETHCKNAYSQYQIENECSMNGIVDKTMTKLFKEYIRTYNVDISLIREGFEDWVDGHKLLRSNCDDECDLDITKTCSLCKQHLILKMKERKAYP